MSENVDLKRTMTNNDEQLTDHKSLPLVLLAQVSQNNDFATQGKLK